MANIDIELANGQKAGETLKQLTNQAAALRKELSGLKPGTQEFVTTAASLNQVGEKLDGIKQQAKSVTAASGEMKQSFSSILGQIPGFGQLKGAMDGATGGVGGLSSAFKALIATPVGAVLAAIVAVIGALTAAMKTDDETADQFGKIWDQISSIFDVVFRRIGLVGRAIKDLVQGNFAKAWDEMKESVSGVGDELQRAWELSGQLADRQNQLDDDLNKFNATEHARKNIIDEIIIKSKDRTKTEAERIDLENKGEALLQKLTKDRMDLTERQSAIDIEKIGLKHNIQRQLNETTQQYGMRLLENSQIGGEEAKTISDGIKKVDEARGESLKMLEKLQNQRNALLDKQEAEEEKKRQAEQKAAEKAEAEKEKLLDQELKAWQKVEDNKIAIMDDGREKDLAKLQLSLQREIEAMDTNAPNYAASLASAQELARSERDKINDKWDKIEGDKSYQNQLKQNELQLITDQNGLSEKWNRGLITQQQYVALSEQNVKESEQRKLDIIKAKFGETSLEYQNQFKKILDLNKQHAEVTAKMIIQSVGQSAGALAGIFGSLASLQNEGSQEAKDLQVAQAEMAAIQGAANAYTSTVGIAFVGPILAPIAAAVALAAGLANVDKIKNTPLPKKTAPSLKAETGGLLVGPRHSEGGIDMNVEGGEFIFSRAAVSGIGVNRLMAMNNQFAAGGPVNPYVDRAPIASGATGASSGNDFINYDKLGDVIALKVADHTRNEIHKIQVHNNVQDTAKGIKVINNLQNEADV